jgi:hypothetical protein
MRTLILAYVIAFLGVAMICGGIWGLLYLHGQAMQVPLRDYGMAMGMTCCGVGMVGVAQALRILLGVVTEVKGSHRILRGVFP